MGSVKGTHGNCINSELCRSNRPSWGKEQATLLVKAGSSPEPGISEGSFLGSLSLPALFSVLCNHLEASSWVVWTSLTYWRSNTRSAKAVFLMKTLKTGLFPLLLYHTLILSIFTSAQQNHRLCFQRHAPLASSWKKKFPFPLPNPALFLPSQEGELRF